jgi:hypothetical protein
MRGLKGKRQGLTPSFLRTASYLALILATLFGATACRFEKASVVKNAPDTIKDKRAKDFSEKPVSVQLPTQAFLIPRNYFTPFGKSNRDVSKLDAFGFNLFLPFFEGYTLDNLNYYPQQSGRGGDHIAITTVAERSKYQLKDGERVEFKPHQWGEPNALFELFMSSGYQLAHEDHGLKCYGVRAATGVFYNTLCKGVRSNGELLVMHTSEEVGEGKSVSRCTVRYYSEKEQLYIQYNFSRDKLHLWKAIDDAIWAKLHSWRVR